MSITNSTRRKNGKQYNNIASIMALPKGMTVNLLEDTYHFDFEDVETWRNWNKIPTWIQDRIKKADNYVSSGVEKYVTEYEEAVKDMEQSNVELNSDDDLPF